ncbi:MAG: Fibronectin type domain protein [Gemmatimonadetes bacterium]|nr:Fibronectin type domain protein [Gemmatimonadota bacterium]
MVSRRLLGRITALAALAAGARIAGAQAPARPPLLAVAKGDSVRIYLLTPPPSFQGYNVYGGPVGSAMTLLTPEPVRPVRNPMIAAGMLGMDREPVMHALDVTDEGAMLHKLEADQFASGVLGFLYPSVSTMLGRLWTTGGLRSGGDYAYRVEFVDLQGKPTSQSAQARIHIADIPVAPPTAPRAAVTDRTAEFTWSYPAHRGNSDDLAFGFNVYRATGSTAPVLVTPSPLLRDETKPALFKDPDLPLGVSYSYTVRAVDVVGRESVPTAPVSVIARDKIPPASALKLVGEAGDRRVSLVWPQAPEPDAAGYHVERSKGLDKPYLRITTKLIAVEKPSYTDSTLSGGTQYFFHIVTVDSSGNESKPSNPVSMLPVDRDPPTAPTLVKAALAPKHTLQVSWTASTSPDVIGYYVLRGESRSVMSRITDKPLAVATIHDIGPDSIGLVAGHKYYYSVIALDGAFNESPAALADIVIPDDVPPGAPTGFHAENVLGRRVDLGWSASPALDVVRYVVERVDSAGTVKPLALVKVSAERAARDTAVKHGRTYHYRVIAVDSAGNKSVPAEDSVTFGTATPPPAPRNAYARKAADGVTVHWERVVSPELAGYQVYRSSLPTGVFELVTPKPISVLSFVDKGASATMYYRVRAVDISHNSSAPSPAVRVPIQ